MEREALLDLDQQVCFPLYAASRAMLQLYQPLLQPLGLTYPQYLVMLVLWKSDGTPVRTLCERLFLDSGTLTPLLDRLEQAGLVKRKRSTDDARVVDIWLTAAGKRLKQRALDVPEGLACKLQLSAAQLVRLRTTLHELFAQMRDLSRAQHGDDDHEDGKKSDKKSEKKSKEKTS
jgi:DNA-binding MarR family transcriptional regulator